MKKIEDIIVNIKSIDDIKILNKKMLSFLSSYYGLGDISRCSKKDQIILLSKKLKPILRNEKLNLILNKSDF